MVKKKKELDILMLEERVLLFQYYMNPTDKLRKRLGKVANEIGNLIMERLKGDNE